MPDTTSELLFKGLFRGLRWHFLAVINNAQHYACDFPYFLE